VGRDGGDRVVLTDAVPLWAYPHKALNVLGVPETIKDTSLIVEVRMEPRRRSIVLRLVGKIIRYDGTCARRQKL